MTELLDWLREVARNGARCPTNPEIGARGFGTNTLPSLARAGLLKLEIYQKNWRVIEIDGMRTEEPPECGKPYMTIDGDGKHKFVPSRYGRGVERPSDDPERVRNRLSAALERADE